MIVHVKTADVVQAATARLDRLEDDQDAAEILGQQSDDEFRLEDSDEGQSPSWFKTSQHQTAWHSGRKT